MRFDSRPLEVIKSKLILTAFILAPACAHAQSLSQLNAELAIIQSQIRGLQAQSRTFTPAKRDEFAQIKVEVAQLKSQLALLEAPSKPAPAASSPPVPMQVSLAAPPPAIPPVPSAPPPGINKPRVGGVLLYAGHGGAFFVAGTLDAGVRYDTGPGHSILSVQSGLMRASRLTFEGYEDVGFGLRAVGVIDGGLNIATGTGASNPAAAGAAFDFGRASFVGIGNDEYGYIDFGRQHAPIWSVSATAVADPFGGAFLGGIAALDPTLSVNSRVSNAITYNYNYTWEGMLDPPPKLGLGFAALYAPAGTDGTEAAPVNAGQQFGAAVSYGTNLFWIGAGYHQIDGWNATDSAYSNTYYPALITNKTALFEETIAASYVTPIARLFVQFNWQTDHRKTAISTNPAINGGVEQDDWLIGFIAPTFTNQMLRFSFGKLYNNTDLKGQYTVAQMSYEFDLAAHPGTALYVDGLIISNSARSAQGTLGATNVITAAGRLTALADQLTKNGVKPDYGATAATIAAGVRFIF